MAVLQIVLAGVALASTCMAAAAQGDRTTTKTVTTIKTTTTTKTSTCPTSSTKTVTVTKTPTSVSTCASPSASSNCFTYNANFDDIVATNPTGPTQLIGVYDSLYFTLGLNTYTDGTTGVVPRSMAHDGAFSVTGSLLAGTPGLSVQYDGSTINYFNLYYFFFGCVLATQEGLLGLPAACNVTATGYSAAGAVIAQNTFEFDPVGTTAQMAPAVLSPSFQNNNLYNVSLSIDGGSLLLAGLADSFLYTVCGSGSIPGNS